MYDPQALLQTIDAHKTTILAGGGLAMIFNYIFFAGAVLAARRDHVFAIPLTASTLWFAHDLSFVLRYQEWFGVYDHWYLKLFWVALIPTTLFELYFIYQAWRYGREELSPGGSSESFNLLIFGAVAAAVIGWWSAKDFLNDPLYAYTFGAIGFVYPVYAIRRLVQRGDAGGQSVITWVAYCCMNSVWFPTTILLFGPEFRTPWYILIGLGSVAGGIVMAVLTSRLRRAPGQPTMASLSA